jgi:ABC-type branched-subunit amino acid transport system ATPase component
MRSISGVLKTEASQIVFDGEPIGALAAPDVMARGIAMTPEGRKLFPSLSVEENLLIGKYGRAVDGPWSLKPSTASFQSSGNGATAPEPRSQVANSRWSQSAAR